MPTEKETAILHLALARTYARRSGRTDEVTRIDRDLAKLRHDAPRAKP